MCYGNNTYTCILATVWTIIQSCAQMVFFFQLKGYYDCTALPPDRIFSQTIYLSYANSRCRRYQSYKGCGEDSGGGNASYADFWVVLEAIDERAKFTPSSSPADRSVSYGATYIFLDSLWIVSSLGLLAGVYLDVRQKMSLWFLAPWVFITVVVAVVDIVAAFHYALDISSVSSLKNWLVFIGVENLRSFDDVVEKHSATHAVTVVSPTVFFLFFYFRFVAFWVVNFFLWLFVLGVAHRLYYEDFDD